MGHVLSQVSQETAGFFGVFSTQAKLVMRAAAKLAPKEVLGAVGPLQQTCLSLATTGDNAAAAAAGGSGVRCPFVLCPKQSS